MMILKKLFLDYIFRYYFCALFDLHLIDCRLKAHDVDRWFFEILKPTGILLNSEPYFNFTFLEILQQILVFLFRLVFTWLTATWKTVVMWYCEKVEINFFNPIKTGLFWFS